MKFTVLVTFDSNSTSDYSHMLTRNQGLVGHLRYIRFAKNCLLLGLLLFCFGSEPRGGQGGSWLLNIIKNRSATYFHVFGGQMSFCGATGIPVLDFK